MATIKPIEGRSVHQIQSGQVIVDLNSVAKELVENALDAGATAIEVRFKNNGLDSIEVQDNGTGIAPEDFDTIALKHYTSKLSTYDDLGSLQTFGFRGEALSSLCALSKFHIITARVSDAPKGTKLEFEPSGKVRGTSVVAAKQGTTVVVEDLFYNLPVRRKELEKTIKREYSKVLSLLHAYACISVGVKFVVSNSMPKGRRAVAFSTQSNPSTKENIANVYGAKTLPALIPLDLKFEMDPSNLAGATQSARNWSTQEDTGSREVKIVGYISRPVVGEGRQTPDRQMFFVNSRPCTLPQVSKAFNEVYKSFNITQSPFIFADIKLDTNAYDVNVSPDKRTILLHDQHALLESLKNSLSELFEGHDQSVPQAQLLDRKLPVFKPPEIRHRESTGSNNAGPSPAQHGPDASATPQSDSEPPTSPVPPVLGGHPGFVKASLIERFAGRDTEERVEHRPPINRRQNGPTGKRPLALSVQEDPEDEGERSMLSIVPDPPGREASPLFEPDAQSDISAHKVSKPVEDFNARIASQLAKRDVNAGSSAQRQEESIPAIIQTPQKSLSQSTIQNAFDRIRPMRTPLQQATITVGDTTSVTTIGNDSRASKRARIHTPKFSLSGAPLDQGTKNSTLLKSLRGFTAPGTQLEEDMEGVESRDDDDEPDSSMPDAHSSRSPSPVKRAPLEKEGHVDGNMTSPEQPRSPRIAENEIQEEEVDEIEAEGPQEDDASDDEYLDESEKKVREEAKIARMIAEAEEAAARPSEMNLKRAQKVFQPSRKKYQTIGIIRDMRTSVSTIERQVQKLEDGLQEEEQQKNRRDGHNEDKALSTQAENPEERLSLTVTKADFHNMRIIGQFNLGFILAVRPPCADSPTSTQDLFIIDQHASDEKYNFERLSSTSVLVSQRLVHPLPLELTAVEEETIRNHEHALAANGFAVKLDSNSCDGSEEGGPRRKARLVALPMSEKVTFNPSDLEELLVLLSESSHHSPSSPPSKSVVLPPGQRNIPRPSKITKILASRACRSSIMIGKNLTHRQMEKVVRHMGEMDKPWSCPHGRPTMRHLFSLDNWEGWDEVDGLGGVGGGGRTDWRGWLEDRMEE